jgi:hypothetical protein
MKQRPGVSKAMPDQDERDRLRNRVFEVLQRLRRTPRRSAEELVADFQFNAIEVESLFQCIRDSYRLHELAQIHQSAIEWRGKLQSAVNGAKGNRSELLRVLRGFGLTSDRTDQAHLRNRWLWWTYVELLTVEGPIYLRPWSEVLSAAMNPLDDPEGQPMISYDLEDGPAHTEPWAEGTGLYHVVPGGEGRIVNGSVGVARAVEVLQEHVGKARGATIKALERAAKFVAEARDKLSQSGVDENQLTEMFGSREIRVPDTWPRESKP